MTRPALPAVACLLLAVSQARAADPLDCVPDSAQVVVVADNPRKLAEAVTGLDAFRRAQALAPVRQLYDSAAARRLLQLLAFAEKELGAKWPDLLDQIGGNGVALAVRFTPEPAPALLVLSGKDEKQVGKAYDLALRNPHTVLHLEHLTYLLAGAAMWWPVIHGRHSSGTKAAYLFCAFVLASPLGLLLALLPTAVYSVYRDAAPTWGIGAVADQQIAGVTMAAEQAVIFFAVFAAYFVRFLGEEERAGSLDELRLSS